MHVRQSLAVVAALYPLFIYPPLLRRQILREMRHICGEVVIGNPLVGSFFYLTHIAPVLDESSLHHEIHYGSKPLSAFEALLDDRPLVGTLPHPQQLQIDILLDVGMEVADIRPTRAKPSPHSPASQDKKHGLVTQSMLRLYDIFFIQVPKLIVSCIIPRCIAALRCVCEISICFCGSIPTPSLPYFLK